MTLYERDGEDINRGLVGYWKLDDLKRVASDGIIAHYKMNDNAADTVVIDSKGGNNGVSVNNTDTMDVVGKVNNALQFNGTTDIITTPIIPSGPRISVAGWFKFDTIGGSHRHVIGNSTNNATNGFHVTVFTDRMLRVYHDGDSINTATLSDGEIFHLALTIDEGNEYKTYFNGALINTKSITGGATINNSNKIFKIGSNDSNTTNRMWDGWVDDVRVYNKILSLSEIETIYNSNTGTETTELFRQTIVAIDRAKFNDGTITGATNTTGINGLNADAMFFDGVDDDVDIGSVSELNLVDNFSISALIKFTSTAQSQIIYGNKGNIFRITEQKLNFQKGSGGFESIQSSVNVPINEWSSVLITKGGSGVGDTKLYINGVLNSANNAVPNLDDFADINIGRQSNASRFFTGSIQNMRIYNRTLTAGEASKLHRLKL